MTDYSELEAFRVKVYKSDRIVQHVAASMTTLVAFDMCIFFAEEFKLVWKAKWTLGKLLYLYIRYACLGVTVAGFYGALYVDPSLQRCTILTQLYTAWACSLTLAIKGTQLLMAIVLHNESWKEKWVLIIVRLTAFAALCGLSLKLIMSYETIEYPFSGVSCALLATFPRPIYIAFYALTIAPDLVTCAASVIKILRLWSGGKSKIAKTIVRDTLIYMLVLALLASPQFVTPLFLPADSTIIVTGLNFVIIAFSGIASCRMVLNLRSIYFIRQDISLSSTIAMITRQTNTIPEMQFARRDDDISSIELDRVSRIGRD